jgi:chemotaxis response regulator CheB
MKRKSGHQVLVVEDVDEMRELLKQVIGRVPGMAVSGTARSTWEARLLITRQRPDIVILDEILPGESSLDLLRELKTQGIPTLLITGVEHPKHPVPEEALGRLNKPTWSNVEEAVQTLGDVLRKALEGS